MKITIEADQFKADNSLNEFTEKKLLKLNQFYDRIIDVHVVFKLENSGQVKDKIVDIVMNIPGDTIVSKSVDKTFENAIDDSVDNLKRQLVRKKEKMREAH